MYIAWLYDARYLPLFLYTYKIVQINCFYLLVFFGHYDVHGYFLLSQL